LRLRVPLRASRSLRKRIGLISLFASSSRTTRPTLAMEICWPARRGVFHIFSMPLAKRVRMRLIAARTSGVCAVRRNAVLRRRERSVRLFLCLRNICGTPQPGADRCPIAKR